MNQVSNTCLNVNHKKCVIINAEIKKKTTFKQRRATFASKDYTFY